MGTSHGDFIKYPRTPHLSGSKGTRQRWIDLFADYNARIELVYVEPPFDRLLRQNKSRKNPVPEHVVRKLAAKCEPPTWTEGHSLLLVDGEAK